MGLTVIQAEDTIDHIAYVQSTQSKFGINNPNETGYDVKIYTSASDVPYSTTLHVLAASYPTDLFINYTPESTTLLKEAPGYIEFPASSTAASFFVDSNQTYSATVRSVTYTLKRLDDNVEVSFTTGENGDQLESFQDPYIRISKSTSKNGIKIIADGAFPQSVKQYLLTASVLFASGHTIQCTKNILIQDDITAVVQSINTHMFDPINTAWQTQFGSTIGKNSLFKVDLFALTGTIDFSTSGANLQSLQTYNGSYLFKYLPNCQGLILDGCTALTNNITIDGQSVNQMNFSEMPELRTLSIQNCTGLTSSIDLTANTKITQVDASGTTINVSIPQGSGITKYELGTPTQISIVNPTALTPSGVKVDSMANAASVDIIGIPNNKSFNTFYNLYNV